MSTPRSSHTCEVMDGLIYVVGGGDGKDWLCSAEVRSKNNFLPLSKSAKTIFHSGSHTGILLLESVKQIRKPGFGNLSNDIVHI